MIAAKLTILIAPLIGVISMLLFLIFLFVGSLHTLYFFSLLLIWSCPDLNVDRFIFNLLWTLWIIFGTVLEEKDLVSDFGDDYRRYQKSIPMLIPWKGRGRI